MTLFRIRLQIEGDAVAVCVAGEVDLATEPSVREAIASALDLGDIRHLAVDLADVTFLDCSGLNALVHGRQLADKRHVAYRVRNATGIAARMLRLGGVSSYLNAD